METFLYDNLMSASGKNVIIENFDGICLAKFIFITQEMLIPNNETFPNKKRISFVFLAFLNIVEMFRKEQIKVKLPTTQWTMKWNIIETHTVFGVFLPWSIFDFGCNCFDTMIMYCECVANAWNQRIILDNICEWRHEISRSLYKFKKKHTHTQLKQKCFLHLN